MLHNIVEDYARAIEAQPDMVADAVIAATQIAESEDEGAEGPFGFGRCR
jgi:hypothetical protein